MDFLTFIEKICKNNNQNLMFFSSVAGLVWAALSTCDRTATNDDLCNISSKNEIRSLRSQRFDRIHRGDPQASQGDDRDRYGQHHNQGQHKDPPM